MERIIYFFLFLLTACESTIDEKYFTIKIPGRNAIQLYEIDIPENWNYEFTENDLLKDTTLPICTLSFEENNEKICIYIHNFPGIKIPPEAQIARWQDQLENSQETKKLISFESFGGFKGIKFQGVGTIKNIEQKMLAWAMQLPEDLFNHFEQLRITTNEIEHLRANFTIKAIGSEQLMNQYQSKLEKIAHSFRLIFEINEF